MSNYSSANEAAFETACASGPDRCGHYEDGVCAVTCDPCPDDEEEPRQAYYVRPYCPTCDANGNMPECFRRGNCTPQKPGGWKPNLRLLTPVPSCRAVDKSARKCDNASVG